MANIYYYLRHAESCEDYDAMLVAGLDAISKSGQEFYWRKCHCIGGQREQTYVVGCGGGYYRSLGPCDWCDAVGLSRNDFGVGAPDSVVNQVVTAYRSKRMVCEAA